MLGSEYSWLVVWGHALRRFRVQLRSSTAVTMAVAGIGLTSLLLPLTRDVLTSSEIPAVPAARLHSPASADAALPQTLLRIGLFLPQLLPRDR